MAGGRQRVAELREGRKGFGIRILDGPAEDEAVELDADCAAAV